MVKIWQPIKKLSCISNALRYSIQLIYKTTHQFRCGFLQYDLNDHEKYKSEQEGF